MFARALVGWGTSICLPSWMDEQFKMCFIADLSNCQASASSERVWPKIQ